MTENGAAASTSCSLPPDPVRVPPSLAGTTEAFSRVRIDALLADAGWSLADGVSVLFEHMLPDGDQARAGDRPSAKED